ncbi:hypothetical protein PV08_11490 [Exophiala spinifera]|uniref:Glycosyl hydrolase family 13 catalytic domain-containing protein n=1 Tax=Exophiala spinifera TaxID=91928 RepID=A0A0D1Y6P3_9EURO|nr:uncharacterized protein PV08_11490 [Exophiala spinifera]KIW10526.1 hypothetical protein PV08_11490 [Exophiala spinifera]
MTKDTNVTMLKQPTRRAWWKESAVYQVYPASFKSDRAIVSHDRNGHPEIKGDIRGVISKVPYLSRLGVDIVWLSPILKSPQVDMGYDISDYLDIDPLYGTMADHDDLIHALHSHGMKYVMDLVVNHTSNEHEWFRDSRSSKTSSKRDWYFWRPPRYSESGERMPPNNWESAFSGSAWEWDETTQEYYLHLFAAEQPDLNWDNPKVRDAVHKTVRFWLDRGVDGFRMDVINFISKATGLPDAKVVKPGFTQPAIKHYACGPHLHEYLQGLGSILHEYSAFSVGEMPGVSDTKEIIKAVRHDRGELAMVFQFDIVEMDIARDKGSKWFPAPFDPRELKRVTSKWNRFMIEHQGWSALFMENHDQGRAVSRYADDSEEHRAHSAKMLGAMMALQCGTVFVYQGQELGQVNFPKEWGCEEYKDIEVVNHWKTVLRDHPNDHKLHEMFKEQYRRIGRDNARTPMQWNGNEETYAGFLPDDPERRPKDVKPWMRVHDDFKQWNAENQLDDDNSPLHYWRRVLELRKQYKHCLVYGDFEMVDMEHKHVVAYIRTDRDTQTEECMDDETRPDKSKCLVLSNFSGHDVWWTMPVRFTEMLVDEETEGGKLKSDAVLDHLRNYNSKNDKENEVRKQDDTNPHGHWAILLRPWEVIVAMI